jgi:hypothetical protein
MAPLGILYFSAIQNKQAFQGQSVVWRFMNSQKSRTGRGGAGGGSLAQGVIEEKTTDSKKRQHWWN